MTLPGASPLYRGFYINLERSAARRERFDTALQRLGLQDRYARFPAIDGRARAIPESALPPGEAGCFLSHVEALERARTFKTPVHILEDDALLSGHVRGVIEEAIAAGLFDHFDILLTDMLVQCHLGMLKGLKQAFDRTMRIGSNPLRFADLTIMDLAQQSFTCLTSYVVGAKAMDKILALYRQEIASGLKTPVDVFIRDQVHAGRLRAACAFPFVTSLQLSEIATSTTLGGNARPEGPSVMALAVLRYSFFAERDLVYAQQMLETVTHGRAHNDPHRDLIVDTLDFVMSDDFREF